MPHLQGYQRRSTTPSGLNDTLRAGFCVVSSRPVRSRRGASLIGLTLINSVWSRVLLAITGTKSDGYLTVDIIIKRFEDDVCDVKVNIEHIAVCCRDNFEGQGRWRKQKSAPVIRIRKERKQTLRVPIDASSMICVGVKACQRG